MGLSFLKSSSYDRSESNCLEPGDPNPENFNIIRLEIVGDYVIADVKYPDASNYDGRKLSLYRATSKELRNAKQLDPHFSDTRGPLVPIARFEHSLDGWYMARTIAHNLSGKGATD